MPDQLDDLRGVIDRACEAVSKGDYSGSIAAYIWSIHLEAERDRGVEQEQQRVREICTDCGRIAQSEEEMDGWESNSDGFSRCFRCSIEKQRLEGLDETAIRHQRDEELRERLRSAFGTHARWAQEDAEAHAAQGRSTAVPLARERERLFRWLVNDGVGDILDGKKPPRSIFEETKDA